MATPWEPYWENEIFRRHQILLNNYRWHNTAGRNATPSEPYLIEVTNTDIVAHDLFLFGADANRYETNYGNDAAIQFINWDVGIDFYQLQLGESANAPVKIGKIIIMGNYNQIFTPIAVIQTSGLGKTIMETIVPISDPYQGNPDVTYIDKSIFIDSNITLITSLLPGAHVKYLLYLEEQLDYTKALSPGYENVTIENIADIKNVWSPPLLPMRLPLLKF